jgi:hypothetical protein
MKFEAMKAQGYDAAAPLIPPKVCPAQIEEALEHETGKGNEFRNGQPQIATRAGEQSSAEAWTGSGAVGGAIPGLTLEQAHVVHGWLAASCGLPRELLGFIAVVAAPSGRYRRRPYLTLAGALHALERAEARGVQAGMIMFEMLRPVARPEQPIVSAIQPNQDAMRGGHYLSEQRRTTAEGLDDLRGYASDPRSRVQGARPARDGDDK